MEDTVLDKTQNNYNGDAILNFVANFDLVLVNTFFEKKEELLTSLLIVTPNWASKVVNWQVEFGP